MADEKDVVLSRRSARLFLEHHGVSGDLVDELELVLGEMCANVVRHAYDRHERGLYEVEVVIDSDGIELTVTDQGRGCTGKPRHPGEFTEDGGMGLFLMSRYADEVEVGCGKNGGTTVRAYRRLRPEPAPQAVATAPAAAAAQAAPASQAAAASQAVAAKMTRPPLRAIRADIARHA